MSDPVVVTGLGIVCSLGSSRADVTRSLRAGERPFAPVGLFDASDFRVNLAAEAVAIDVSGRFGSRFVRRTSRTDRLAAWAVADALAHADLGSDALQNAGLYVGASSGGMAELEAARGAGRPLDFRTSWSYPIWSTAQCLASVFGIRGVRSTYMTACSSSAHAIGLAMRRVRSGDEDVVIAGGAESLCRLTLAGFGALGVLDPSGARPFDADRRGITLGEGAAFVVLESLARARRRGVPPLAVIAGYGASAEAHHMVHPKGDGSGALATMRAALRDAGCEPGEIDYINAHGTGTTQNDAMEATAVGALVGGRAVRLSSSKGMLGHALGAAGALEAAVTIIGMTEGFVPSNPGVSTPAPELGAIELLSDVVDEAPRLVVSTSFAFGGNNAALVIAHPESTGARGVSPTTAAQAQPVVVITAGAVASPLGTATDVGRLTRLLDPQHHASGRDLVGLNPAAVLGRGVTRRMDPLSAAVTALYVEAIQHAGLDDTVGLAVGFGTAFGALDPAMKFLERLFAKGPHLVNPLEFPNLVHNAPAGHAAMRLAGHGPSITACQEELAGDDVIMATIDLLCGGDAPAGLAGGGDLASDDLDQGYAAVDRVIGTSSTHASVIGLILLERADACEARGAQPWARLLGHGAAGPRSGVAGAVDRALERAKRAGCAPEHITLWYRGAVERFGRGHEARARTHPLLSDIPEVNARAILGDAAGAGPAALAIAAATIAIGGATTILITAVTRDGNARAFLLGPA